MGITVPRGRISPPGFALLVGLAGTAALLLALCFSVLAQAVHPFLLSSVCWALLLGGALATATRVGKCRSVPLVLLVGALSAILSCAAFHHFQNRKLHADIAKLWSVELKVSMETIDQMRRRYPEARELFETHFWPDLEYRSEPRKLTKFGGDDFSEKALIHGMGLYAYWLGELVLLIGCALYGSLRVLKTPFCEPCSRWYTRTRPDNVTGLRANRAWTALTRDDFEDFASCMDQPSGTVGFSFESCPACQEGKVVIRLEALEEPGRRQARRRVLFKEMFTRERWTALAAALERRATQGGLAGR